MKNFKLTVFILLVFGVFTNTANAQQDAQYTQYMYNTLSINPAYAGSRDVLSFLALYRSQWVGLDGAPRTFTVSGHSPLGENMGIGVNVTNDEIFISKETYFDIDFSYSINFTDVGKVAFGIKGGGHLLNVDSNLANQGPYNPGDGSSEIFIDNKFSPQFGAGLYYYTQKFYAGFSVPNFLETEHFDESSNSNSNAIAKERMNYYLMTGYTFDLSENVLFKPSVLGKIVEGAPLQVDLSANFLFYEKFTVGAAYRWSAAFSGMVGFQVTDQIMLGFAYDQETTDLAQYNNGSYEFFLRFELFNNSDRIMSPRFF
jgi:type IX secretion system PorP/SprF family membrane protein